MNKIYVIVAVAVLLTLAGLQACTNAGVTETCNPTTTIMCPVQLQGDSDSVDSIEANDAGNAPDYCYDAAADTEATCEGAGGLWSLYDTGCRDSCYAEYYGDLVECTEENTYGCNCGPNACWDECLQTCVDQS